MSKLTYIRCGDYDIPNLKLSEQPETSIGKYGRMRKSYLMEHSPNLYNHLLMSEKRSSIVSFLRKERYNIIIPVILSYRADFCISRSSYKKTVTRPSDFTRYPITVAVCGGNCDFLLG